MERYRTHRPAAGFLLLLCLALPPDAARAFGSPGGDPCVPTLSSFDPAQTPASGPIRPTSPPGAFFPGSSLAEPFSSGTFFPPPVSLPRHSTGDSLSIDLIDRTLFASSFCSFADGDRLYLGAGTALLIYDISTPTDPTLLGYTYTAGIVWNIWASADTAYLADGAAGLRIYDCRDPAACRPAGGADNPAGGYAYGVWVRDGLALVADGVAGLLVIDLRAPGGPEIIGQSDPLAWYFGATDVRVTGDIAFMTAANISLIDTGYLVTFDISNPSAPDTIRTYDTDGPARALHVEPDTTVFVANGYRLAGGRGNLLVFDCTDPSSPLEVGYFRDSTHYGLDVAVEGDRIYLADGYMGGNGGNFLVFDRNDVRPDMAPIGSYTTLDIAWGVSARDEIAYISDEWGGLDVVDCRTLPDLRSLAIFDLGGYPQDVAVHGDLAFVAAEGGNIRVVDVSDPRNLEETAMIQTQSWASAVAARGDTLYVAEGWDVPAQGNSAVEAILAADIHNPVRLDLLDYGVSGHCYDLFSAGNRIYVAKGIDGLVIVDATHPTNLSELGRLTPPDRAVYDVFVQDTIAYLAMGDPWDILHPFDPDSSGLLLVNVRDPASPSPMGYWRTASECRGVCARDSLAYLAAGPKGLRIVNCADPWNPEEIGSLDTDGTAHKVTLAGSNALVTDGEGGLGIIDVGDPENPAERAGYPTTGDAYGLTVNDLGIFVADRYAGLFLLETDLPLGIGGDGGGSRGRGGGVRAPRGAGTHLLQNQPNPFNPSTTISYGLERDSAVRLEIFDVRGRMVRTLVDGDRGAGVHSVAWDGRASNGERVASGVYICRLVVVSDGGRLVESRKMVVVR